MAKILEFPKKKADSSPARIEGGRIVRVGVNEKGRVPLTQVEFDIRMERVKESLRKINELIDNLKGENKYDRQ